MAMRLLPLGSVIQVNDYKAFIIGYTTVKRREADLIGYFIVSYPIGFTGVDKVVFIPHDYKFTVVAEGYKTKESEALLCTLSKSLETVATASRDDIARLNQLLKDKNSLRTRGTVE